MVIDLNQPQVIAAIVGGTVAAVVSVAVAVINQLSLRSMHKQKLEGDRDLAERKITADIALAERKFEFDQRLAERKVDLDIAMAERKLTLDQALAIWRRRYDLAEQVLATAYEARDALVWARAPVGFSGEGETRNAVEKESGKLRERRNSYFVPNERLSRDKEIFSKLETFKYSVAAQFGEEAAKTLRAFTEVYLSIGTATGILIAMTHEDDNHSENQSFIPMLEVLGRRSRPDASDKKINDAIAGIEAVCKPVLSERPSA